MCPTAYALRQLLFRKIMENSPIICQLQDEGREKMEVCAGSADKPEFYSVNMRTGLILGPDSLPRDEYHFAARFQLAAEELSKVFPGWFADDWTAQLVPLAA